jgi:RNA polymerase sigma-70 factor (ECF subfamily)
LFASYAPYVAAISARLLGRGDEIDDVVQEVFLIVVAGVHRVRNVDAIKGWLATVTVRVAMQRLRWRRLRVWLHIDGDRHYDDLPDPSLSGEERAAIVCIYRLLDRVPVAQRSAWLLHHGEGLPATQVAELCDCSLATAKRWIASVNEKVRKAIVDG